MHLKPWAQSMMLVTTFGRIGRHISAITGDARELPFSLQRISVGIQRWNAASLIPG